MNIKNFEALEKLVLSGPVKTAAVAAAHDEHTLEAVFAAEKAGAIKYILIGNRDKIQSIGKVYGKTIADNEILDASTDEECAFKAVEAIRDGRADFIVKGLMQTSTILKAVVNKETGIGTGKIMSHVALMDIPSYPKLLGVTDGGMVLRPSLEQKKGILENAVGLFKRLGYDTPKAGILCAVENVNPKMQETVDAAELKKAADAGAFGECFVEGPISFDLATDKDAVKIKNYESPVAGDADILVVPEITAGNAMCKALYVLGGASMAGCIVGAKAPIALNSRGASFEEKYYSIILCAKLAE